MAVLAAAGLVAFSGFVDDVADGLRGSLSARLRHMVLSPCARSAAAGK